MEEATLTQGSAAVIGGKMGPLKVRASPAMMGGTTTRVSVSTAENPYRRTTTTYLSPWNSTLVDVWPQSQICLNSQPEGYNVDNRAGNGAGLDQMGMVYGNIPFEHCTQVDAGDSNASWRETPQTVDNVTMKECDNLINNLTPELLKEYADFITSSGSNTNNTGGQCVGSGLSSAPVKSPSLDLSEDIKPFHSIRYIQQDPNNMCLTRSNPTDSLSQISISHTAVHNTSQQAPPPTSVETLENIVEDPLLVSNALHPEDMLRSPCQASSPRELPLDGSFNLSVCGSDVGDETSVSALSETLSVKSHGSGGTVTIMRKETQIPQSPQGLSEPLARLLAPLVSPPPSKMSLDPDIQGDDVGLDAALACDLGDDIQVGLITGSGPHSDDEEISDDFNWDKIL
ncbi:hypothetical protein SK128_028566 [Halocaridina rubra]|uniref:Uncharacterized protein n=1 Tax=Halocaridina rubra TaxID=373956 RepID=A0AAN8XMW8_HALRR